MKTIEFGERKIKLIKSKRNKYMRLSITPHGEIKLSVPFRVGDGQIIKFLGGHSAWIESVLAKFGSAKRFVLRSGNKISIIDQDFEIITYAIENANTKCHIDPHTQRIYLFAGKDTANSEQLQLAKFKEVVSRYAKKLIEKEIGAIANGTDLGVKRISIREQRSRWGSCSNLGNLNFNWKIVLTPYSVFRYVICHELAHLKQHNHSPLFWAEVEKLHPTYRSDRIWLKRNGHSLPL